MIDLKKTASGIQVEGKELAVMDFYDVVVIGGGVAGCAAAMAAGKRGMRTVLLETFTALGGLTTLGLVNIPLDFVSGLGKEMFKELEAVKGHWHRNTDPEKHKLVLDRMIKKYNVEVLFHSQVIDSIVEGDAIVGVVIQTKGNVDEDNQPATETPDAPAESDTPAESTPETTPAKTVLITAGNGGKVNIRVGNGTNYGRITSVASGTALPYIATAPDGWHAVALSDRVGWVSGKYSTVNT